MFEYLYYPGYWLAKGYAYEYAALWRPNNHQDLYHLDEGYAWEVIKSNDNQSVYLKTRRPGYNDQYFIGREIYEEEDDEDEEDNIYVSNTGYVEGSKLPELFDFRIMCTDSSCESMDKCILVRVYDRYQVYANSRKIINACWQCGSADWFNWRVHAPDNVTFISNKKYHSNVTSIATAQIKLLVIFFNVYYFLSHYLIKI